MGEDNDTYQLLAFWRGPPMCSEISMNRFVSHLSWDGYINCHFYVACLFKGGNPGITCFLSAPIAESGDLQSSRFQGPLVFTDSWNSGSLLKPKATGISLPSVSSLMQVLISLSFPHTQLPFFCRHSYSIFLTFLTLQM